MNSTVIVYLVGLVVGILIGVLSAGTYYYYREDKLMQDDCYKRNWGTSTCIVKCPFYDDCARKLKKQRLNIERENARKAKKKKRE